MLSPNGNSLYFTSSDSLRGFILRTTWDGIFVYVGMVWYGQLVVGAVYFVTSRRLNNKAIDIPT